MKTQLIKAQLPQVNTFFALVSCDAELSTRLEKTNSDAEFSNTAAQLAQYLGFSFSAGDVEEYFQQQKLEFEATSSYSEDDLAAGAGGGVVMQGCPGLITSICTFITGCWFSLC